MHARESGVVDHLATSDEHALSLARQAVGSLAAASHSYTSPVATEKVEEPLYDPKELGGTVGTNVKKSFDMREVIARTVDGSRFAEWKREWGETVVTGFAKVHGHQVGIVRRLGFSPFLPIRFPGS
jgi:3-methylcrotonyl-CoA carboxylase beta subunit